MPNNALSTFPPIMDVKTASKYLLTGRDLLYELAARDEIPHFHVGRYLRFNRADIDAWARGHEHRRADLYGGRKPMALRKVR